MARSNDAHIRVQGLQPVQVLAGLVGLAYLAFGIVGFARTGLSDFAGHPDVMVLGFLVNPLQNLVNVVVGVLGVLCATTSGLSRTFGWVLFLGWGVVAVWGLMITGTISTNPVSNLGNPLNLNQAGNWLHIGTAVLGLIMMIIPARKVVHVPEPAVTEPLGTGQYDTPTRTDVSTPEETSPAEPGEKRRASWLPGRRHHTAAH